MSYWVNGGFIFREGKVEFMLSDGYLERIRNVYLIMLYFCGLYVDIYFLWAGVYLCLRIFLFWVK